jgi:hypothetical protein
MWQTFSNTDHVYDLAQSGSDLYFSTWGGVVHLQKTAPGPDSLDGYEESETINTGNGLVSNDIRNLSFIDFSQSLWMGSSDEGISILGAAGMQQLTSSLGLPSTKVTRIIENESTILVGTSAGLAVFYYLPGVNFPLMLHQYTAENTNGGMASSNVEDLLLSADRDLYVATSAGISYIALDSLDVDSAWHSLNGVGSPVPTGSAPKLSANSEYLAIAVNNTVYRYAFNSGTWQVINSSNGLLGQKIASVHLDAANNLWVSYGDWDEELLLYTRTDDTLMTSISFEGLVTNYVANTNGLGHSCIHRILSLNNQIYLCSWGDGIYQKSGEEWLNFKPSTIGFPKITQIVTDNDYSVWFASGYYDNDPVRKGTMGVSKLSGSEWQTFNITNSPIHTDNVVTLAVDANNRKWFGAWDNAYNPLWEKGVSIFDESSNLWKHMSTSGLRVWNNDTSTWGSYNTDPKYKLTTATIGGIYPAADNLMMVSCYDGGVNVINMDDEIVARFQVFNSVYQRIIYSTYSGNKYFFGTNNDHGLIIWNHDSIPETEGDHWLIPSPPELNNCIVYGVVSVDTPYEGRQHWIAASTGLFMWNEVSWFRYDTMIKRFKYNVSTRLWENETLYYENEERLFGSVRTSPTSIMLDPFNRVWIGSEDNGLTMYNPNTERFTNFFKPNFPLLSNFITALGYDPVAGNLIIGSPDGVNTYKIGRTVKPDTALNNLKAYPNPFRPDQHYSVQIVNQPDDSLPAGTSTCKIYDTAGALVAVIKENAFSRFEWNGTSSTGKKCASGVYYFVVGDEQGNLKRGKLALIR